LSIDIINYGYTLQIIHSKIYFAEFAGIDNSGAFVVYFCEEMDTWVKVARKKAKCNYCGGDIEKGSYMVVVKSWRNREGEPRKWMVFFRYHAEKDGKCCYIEQAKAALERREIVETRGKKKLPITDEMKAARRRVLLRRASVLQRIRAEMEKEEQSVDKIIHLGGLLVQLKEEIEKLGGAPKSW